MSQQQQEMKPLSVNQEQLERTEVCPDHSSQKLQPEPDAADRRRMSRRIFFKELAPYALAFTGVVALYEGGAAITGAISKQQPHGARTSTPHAPEQQPNTQQHRPTAEQEFEKRRDAAITACTAEASRIVQLMLDTGATQHAENGIAGAVCTNHTTRNGRPYTTRVEAVYGVDHTEKFVNDSTSYIRISSGEPLPTGRVVEESDIIFERSPATGDWSILQTTGGVDIFSTAAGPSARTVDEEIAGLDGTISKALSPFMQD